MARIILLNGPSSSGKTTIAKALQAKLDAPFLHLSIDHLRDADVLPMSRFQSGDFAWSHHRAAIFDGFHGALAAFADAGNDLIVEHILDEPRWIARLTSAFANHDVLFVGVHAKRTNLIAREKQRGDRELGSAARDDKIVHQGRHYDLDIQSEDGVEANVIRIMAAMEKTRNSDFSA